MYWEIIFPKFGEMIGNKMYIQHKKYCAVRTSGS